MKKINEVLFTVLVNYMLITSIIFIIQNIILYRGLDATTIFKQGFFMWLVTCTVLLAYATSKDDGKWIE